MKDKSTERSGNNDRTICKKQSKPIYIQVSYLLASEKTLEREFKPLKNIKDNYPKYVITMDEINMSHEGIEHLNLIDFLLGEMINLSFDFFKVSSLCFYDTILSQNIL